MCHLCTVRAIVWAVLLIHETTFVLQVNNVHATPAQLKCPWPSEMGKVTWGPCKSGELVTCGNHAYAMWRAEGAEHECQPMNNLVNATKWPQLTVGTNLPLWQPLRPKAASTPAATAAEGPPAIPGQVSAIAEGVSSGPSPQLRALTTEAVDTPTTTIRRNIATYGVPSLRTPGGGALSAAMLQSPAGIPPSGGAPGSAVTGQPSTPSAGPGSSRAPGHHVPRSGAVTTSAARVTATPVLEASGTNGPGSKDARTDTTQDAGVPAEQADKPSQHGLENLFMSLTSPTRIERPAR